MTEERKRILKAIVVFAILYLVVVCLAYLFAFLCESGFFECVL